MQYAPTGFSDGDIVQLKSGGPLMAIKVHVDELLLCEWLSAEGRTCRGTFRAHQVHLTSAQPLWVRVASRLCERMPVVAICAEGYYDRPARSAAKVATSAEAPSRTV